MSNDDDDMNQGCEMCGNVFRLDTMTSTDDDCWICAGCQARFKEVFDACEHEWQPHTDKYGDPAKVCHKCCGVVVEERA